MITERRRKRIYDVLSKRQNDIVIVSEWIYKESNISALMRTADAFGIFNIYIVRESFSHNAEVSKGSEKWLKIKRFSSSKDMINDLKENGYKIVVTGFSENAVKPEDIDFTVPTAIVFGNELDGISEYTMKNADIILKIPMVGMVQSLNVSVSAGIIMYEIFKQRMKKGMYDNNPTLSMDEKKEIFQKWTGLSDITDFFNEYNDG